MGKPIIIKSYIINIYDFIIMVVVKLENKISIDKVSVRSTKDKRKSLRVPADLYEDVMLNLKFGEKRKLFDKILQDLLEEFEKDKRILNKEFKGNTKPVKISEKSFKIIKVLKFKSDKSNTDIAAAALMLYKERRNE